jgi:hypothetical protein
MDGLSKFDLLRFDLCSLVKEKKKRIDGPKKKLEQSFK